MQALTRSLFDGLPDGALEDILGRLRLRRFAAGKVIVAEGLLLNEIYLVESGVANAFVADADGREHVVNRLTPGSVIGEMSLVTGQPTSATVRAATEVSAYAMTRTEFQREAASFPRIYQNVAAILSAKLAAADRRQLNPGQGRITLLLDHGAPPALSYALAASMAWHLRKPVAVLDQIDSVPADLSTLERTGNGSVQAEPRVHLVTGDPDLSVDEVLVRAERLCYEYAHVLIRLPASTRISDDGVRMVRLAGPAAVLGRAEPGPSLRAVRAWMPWRREQPDVNGEIRIPSLTEAERRALALGCLPPTGRGSRLLGWCARDLAHLKVGLALGAGSSKGYAHFGVAGVLASAGVPIDYIAGTSIGSLVATMIATGRSLEESARLLDGGGAAVFRLGLPRSSLLSGAGLTRYLQDTAGDDRIEDSVIPLAVIAADLKTRREIVLRRGLLRVALRASTSIPGILPPLPMGPYLLVDGGILNPIPSSAVVRMGADVTIAVHLSRYGTAPAIEAEAVETHGRLPWALQTIMQSIEIMQSGISTIQPEGTTVPVEVDFSGEVDPGIRHFSAGRRFIALGEAAMRAALPQLATMLPWLQPQVGDLAPAPAEILASRPIA